MSRTPTLVCQAQSAGTLSLAGLHMGVSVRVRNKYTCTCVTNTYTCAPKRRALRHCQLAALDMGDSVGVRDKSVSMRHEYMCHARVPSRAKRRAPIHCPLVWEILLELVTKVYVYVSQTNMHHVPYIRITCQGADTLSLAALDMGD